MAYEELRKLYYGDKDVYKQTYTERFSSDLTLKFDFEVKGKTAFMVECRDVIQPMYDILRLDKEVSELCDQLPDIAQQQYSRKCLIDEIVISNNIEGVYSSRKEIGQALSQLEEQSREKGKSVRFDGMVNKYAKLMRGEEVPLGTCQDIRMLYDEIVLTEVVEENKDNAPDGALFRKDQATVRSVTDRVIHTGLTPERKIIEAMDKALAFLRDDTVEELYRICLFHYMMEYIHPFYDGNGRLGRFILSYCISKTLTPLLAYRISEIIKENLKDYYNAFVVCNDPHSLGDLTPFLIMMLGMIKKAYLDLRDSLKRKLISWARYEYAVQQFARWDLKQSQICDLLIQAALFGELGISTQELMSAAGLSYGTMRKHLDAIAAHGLLVTVKEGKEKFYSINMEVLDNKLLQ